MERTRAWADSAVIKILIGVLVVIGIVVVAGVGFGVYIARNSRVEEVRSAEGKTVRIETPVGSMRVNEQGRLDPEQLGVPMYPGATPAAERGKAVNVEFNIPGLRKRLEVGEYTTPDPARTVTEFYRKRLPQWSYITKFDGSVEFKRSEGGTQRAVAIRERHSRTVITLVRIGEGRG